MSVQPQPPTRAEKYTNRRTEKLEITEGLQGDLVPSQESVELSVGRNSVMLTETCLNCRCLCTVQSIPSQSKLYLLNVVFTYLKVSSAPADMTVEPSGERERWRTLSVCPSSSAVFSMVGYFQMMISLLT